MRITFPILLAGLLAGCQSPAAAPQQSARIEASGLLGVVVRVDRLE